MSLVPTHTDRVGSLRFLASTAYAFAVLAIAHGAIFAGTLANRILFLGAALTEFKVEIALMMVFVLVALLGPLPVFTFQLSQTKRTGIREYGTLAQRYVREFDAKRCAAVRPPISPW